MPCTAQTSNRSVGDWATVGAVRAQDANGASALASAPWRPAVLGLLAKYGVPRKLYARLRASTPAEETKQRTAVEAAGTLLVGPGLVWVRWVARLKSRRGQQIRPQRRPARNVALPLPAPSRPFAPQTLPCPCPPLPAPLPSFPPRCARCRAVPRSVAPLGETLTVLQAEARDLALDVCRNVLTYARSIVRSGTPRLRVPCPACTRSLWCFCIRRERRRHGRLCAVAGCGRLGSA